MRWGRISWWMARVSSITKMFSSFRTFAAGRLSGILIGTLRWFKSRQKYLLIPNNENLSGKTPARTEFDEVLL
jgi:hypothetical protein